MLEASTSLVIDYLNPYSNPQTHQARPMLKWSAMLSVQSAILNPMVLLRMALQQS